MAVDARAHARRRSAEVYAQRAARARTQAQQVRDLVEAGREDRERDDGPAAHG